MPNRLVQENSPYLLQHADNPVDWWPWSEESLALARTQDRPILLSIGYSACHWCHVMAHESFADPQVAEVMNRLFINIKVDREERPDLDQIYQTAHQMLAQRAGGWPLTMFLTPDGTPFFGGTYFPKSPRYGLPGFVALMERVAETFRDRRGAIEEQNQRLHKALRESTETPGSAPAQLNTQPLAALLGFLEHSFDRNHGGFGPAPKFPHATDLEFLLYRYHTTGNQNACDMALRTLEKMARGGIHDQLGGGFYRYSTDERWEIPHFEKMLYDNGPLLSLYADAWTASGEDFFADIAKRCANWMIEQMQAPQGGFYSALDADSEGKEGRFYLWQREEIAQRLPELLHPVAMEYFGLDQEPNFEGDAWHLTASVHPAALATRLDLTEDEVHKRLKQTREVLLQARQQRVPPGCDDKILTSWNALAIQSLVHAGRILGQPEWIAAARRALTFLRTTMWREGRLYATTCKGAPGKLNAYLDDHAFLLAALLEMLQADFRPEDLDWAQALANELLTAFADSEHGGFFFTRKDHERLILRPIPAHDNATPAGNGIAARALLRLGHLTGEATYLQAAERCLQRFFPLLSKHPGGCSSLALALHEFLSPPCIVVLRGSKAALADWVTQIRALHLPDSLIFALDTNLQNLPPLFNKTLNKPLGNDVNAWVCSGVTCLPPIDQIDQLVAEIRQVVKPSSMV